MAMDGGYSSLGFQNLASSWPPGPAVGQLWNSLEGMSREKSGVGMSYIVCRI